MQCVNKDHEVRLFLVPTAGKVNVWKECAFGEWKSQGNVPSYNIPSPTWLQTPSIVEITAGTGRREAVTVQTYKPTTQPHIVQCIYLFIFGRRCIFDNYQLSLQYPFSVLPSGARDTFKPSSAAM